MSQKILENNITILQKKTKSNISLLLIVYIFCHFFLHFLDFFFLLPLINRFNISCWDCTGRSESEGFFRISSDGRFEFEVFFRISSGLVSGLLRFSRNCWNLSSVSFDLFLIVSPELMASFSSEPNEISREKSVIIIIIHGSKNIYFSQLKNTWNCSIMLYMILYLENTFCFSTFNFIIQDTILRYFKRFLLLY